MSVGATIENAPSPLPEEKREQFRSAFFHVAPSMFLGALDQTIMATALPAIAGSLGRLSYLAWVVTATFVSHSFWLAAGTPQFQGQLINFCKNIAIWGGLVFVAGTTAQPSLLPRHTARPSEARAKSSAQTGAIHVEADKSR